MTLEQLIVFDAIICEGTFRGAAEKLHKSQSALSYMLKKLEQEIEITLISRDDYRPKLTPAGEIFYRQSVQVLQAMQRLKNTSQQLKAQLEPEVVIGVTATYPLKNILSVMQTLGQEYPATHIKLMTETMGGSIESLLNDESDLIIASTDGVSAEQVDMLPFQTIRILPVAHHQFEAVQKTGVKSIQDMQQYVQVVVADSSREQKHLQSRDLLPGGKRWTVTEFSAKKEILMARMGWGGMPEFLVEDELKRGEFVVLDVEGYQPRETLLHIMRKKNRTHGLVAQKVWQALSEMK